MVDDDNPLALQLAVRVEKIDPPSVTAICEAAGLATVALLEHPNSAPNNPWHADVEAWNGARIRKLVRRGRGAAWQRVQTLDGVTVSHDGAEVRAFVPGPVRDAPTELAKLQIRSTPLPEPDQTDTVIAASGLVVVITPHVEMSWGKRAAQCAHAVQRAWMTASAPERERWDSAGRTLAVVHASQALWATVADTASTQIHDGGYTEIPAGTRTTVAWWAS